MKHFSFVTNTLLCLLLKITLINADGALGNFYPKAQALSDTYSCCAYHEKEQYCDEEDEECIDEYRETIDKYYLFILISLITVLLCIVVCCLQAKRRERQAKAKAKKAPADLTKSDNNEEEKDLTLNRDDSIHEAFGLD